MKRTHPEFLEAQTETKSNCAAAATKSLGMENTDINMEMGSQNVKEIKISNKKVIVGNKIGNFESESAKSGHNSMDFELESCFEKSTKFASEGVTVFPSTRPNCFNDESDESGEDSSFKSSNFVNVKYEPKLGKHGTSKCDDENEETKSELDITGFDKSSSITVELDSEEETEFQKPELDNEPISGNDEKTTPKIKMANEIVNDICSKKDFAKSDVAETEPKKSRRQFSQSQKSNLGIKICSICEFKNGSETLIDCTNCVGAFHLSSCLDLKTAPLAVEVWTCVECALKTKEDPEEGDEQIFSQKYLRRSKRRRQPDGASSARPVNIRQSIRVKQSKTKNRPPSPAKQKPSQNGMTKPTTSATPCVSGVYKILFHECTACSKLFIFTDNLVEHQTSHRHSGSSQKIISIPKSTLAPCPLCSREFDENSQLFLHISGHSEENPKKCEIESFEVTSDNFETQDSRTNMEIHISQTYPVPISQKMKRNYFHKSNRSFQIAKSETNTCRSTKKTRTISEKRKIIMNTEKSNLPIKKKLTAKKGFHKCTWCGNVYKRPTYLRQHVTIHTGEKLNKCKQCSKVFRFSSSLSHHYRKKHGG